MTGLNELKKKNKNKNANTKTVFWQEYHSACKNCIIKNTIFTI